MQDYERFDRLGALIENQRLPIAVVDLEAFDQNLKEMGQIATSLNKPIRIATKSIRVPNLIQRALDFKDSNGKQPFRGLLCYNAGEARKLSELGFDDFLLAYPTVGQQDLGDLRALAEAGKTVRVVVDSKAGAEVLAQAMRGLARPFEVLLDIDASVRLIGGVVHFGVRRSPLRSDTDIAACIDAIQALSQLRLVGAMVYEAQIAGLQDRNPFTAFLNPIAHWIRKFSIARVAKRRRDVVRIFREKEVDLQIFNGGGSGSLNISVLDPSLTELAAGSGLLAPHLFDYYSNISFHPALYFALPVSRASDPYLVTCFGGGYVASGSVGEERLPKVVYPKGASLLNLEGAGEVQTPVQVKTKDTAALLGKPIWFRHAKAGELAERFSDYTLVENLSSSNARLDAIVKTYRGHGWCFF